MSKKHNRRTIRLRGFDYASTGAYYVTLNVKYRTPLFGTLRNGVMHLSPIGQIVQEEWLRTPNVRPEVVLDEFIIMPDHMHMIVWIRDGMNVGATQDATTSIVGARRTRPLGNIIGGFKGSVTHRIQNEIDKGACHAPRHRHVELRHESIWQRNYYERIVRDERELRTFRNYIIENPIKG